MRCPSSHTTSKSISTRSSHAADPSSCYHTRVSKSQKLPVVPAQQPAIIIVHEVAVLFFKDEELVRVRPETAPEPQSHLGCLAWINERPGHAGEIEDLDRKELIAMCKIYAIDDRM